METTSQVIVEPEFAIWNPPDVAKQWQPKKREKRVRPKLSPKNQALETAENGRNVAAVVCDAIRDQLPDDADILAVYAARLALCNRDGNIWYAQDLTNRDGDAFDGAGRFAACGHKLCPHCLQKQSKRNRDKLRHAIREQRVDPDDPNSIQGLPVGQDYVLLTLTMQNLGITIREARSVINYAWSLYRKRKWFKDHIIGYGKNEEFTLTGLGVHYHIHGLCRARSFDWNDAKSNWTQCVRKSFRRHNLPWNVATKNGYNVLNVSKIDTIENAINEVCKYVTKTSTWTKLDADHLLDVCRIKRWHRMAELGGTFKPSRTRPLTVASCQQGDIPIPTNYAEAVALASLLGKQETQAYENALKQGNLDTSCIADGGADESWRGKVRMAGVAAYLDKLHWRTKQQIEIRTKQLMHSYPSAKFRRVNASSSINAEQYLDLISTVYDRAGRPPPESMQKHLSFDQRVEIALKYSTAIAGGEPNATRA